MLYWYYCSVLLCLILNARSSISIGDDENDNLNVTLLDLLIWFNSTIGSVICLVDMIFFNKN